MKVNYSNEKPVRDSYSIFLAGPTPRKKEVPSWRPDALDILEDMGFQGTVYVPERRGCVRESFDYLTQVEWEYECLENCGAICFWVPRKLPDMPAFTTNVEFGRYVTSGRAFYARPDWAEKIGYLDWLYKKMTGKNPSNDMHGLFYNARNFLEEECLKKMSEDA